MAEYFTLQWLVYLLGIPASHFTGLNPVFYIIIPFVISSYALYSFMNSMRILPGATIKVIAVLIIFVLLRFLYPFLFIIAILYLVTIKGWPKSVFFRVLFIVLMFALYFVFYPYLSEMISKIA